MDGSELQEFIDRYNAAWNAHDVDAIVAMHTDDSVFENHVTGDVNVGREQIGDSRRKWGVPICGGRGEQPGAKPYYTS